MLSKEERNYQEEIRKLQNIDLRCIKRETKISRITACVAKPCDPLPDDPLPRWSGIPLDHKFPVIPCAPGQFPFSRSRIGDSLFRCNPGKEFDIEDPNIRRTPIQYEPLHDPNLKNYFLERPHLIRSLEEQGLINCPGSVICSISDFNKYRDYLGRLHNKAIDEERGRQDRVIDADFQQIKRIKQYFWIAANRLKLENIKARLEQFRSEKDRRDLLAKLKEIRHPSNTYKEKLAKERALKMRQREYLRQRKEEKLEEMRRQLLQHNRNLVLEWYCRDLYADQLRKSMLNYKQKLHKAEMEDFVKCKREYQEEKLRYEQAILFRAKLEQECSVIRRKEHYEKLEALRKDSLRRKAEMEQKKAERDLYLIRKYGGRWLAIVAAKRKAVSTYHDSLWAVRGQLRSLVAILREESGTQSFTAFIHGLVKMKPGRVVIEMKEDTKDVINYILKLLIEKSYKEYIRKTTDCALDFLSEATRARMGRRQCPPGDVMNLEDFIPPLIRKRFKPLFPYVKPPWPCCGPCSELKVRQTEGDWKKRCAEMAECLTEVHNSISNFLTDRMCRVLENQTCQEVVPCMAKIKKPKKKICSERVCRYDEICEEAHFLTDAEIDRMAIKAKSPSLIACALTREAIAKNICPSMHTGVQCVEPYCKDVVLLSEEDVQRMVREGASSSELAEYMARDAITRSVCTLPPDSPRSGSSGLSDLAEMAVKDAISKSMTNTPVEMSTIAIPEKQVLQLEKDVIKPGDDNRLGQTMDDASGVAKSSISEAMTGRPVQQGSPRAESSGFSDLAETGVKDAISKSMTNTPEMSTVYINERPMQQLEKDMVKPGDDDQLGEMVDDISASGVATSSLTGWPVQQGSPRAESSGLSDLAETGVKDAISKSPAISPVTKMSTASVPEVCLSRTPSTDVSFVDQVIQEQKQLLQLEKDVIETGDDDQLGQMIDQTNMSRITSEVATSSICKELKSVCSVEPDSPPSGSSSEVCFTRSPSTDFSFVDRVIQEQKELLQLEKDVIKTGDDDQLGEMMDITNISRMASGVAKSSICKELTRSAICPSGSEVCFTRSPSTDFSFVDQVIREQRQLLQLEKDVINTGDDDQLGEMMDITNISRMASGVAKSSICKELKTRAQPDSSDTEEVQVCMSRHVTEQTLRQSQHEGTDESAYLDPFEQGISPVRSEIRLHLNSIRGELENLKSQLIGQGIISQPPPPPDDSSEDDHPAPGRS